MRTARRPCDPWSMPSAPTCRCGCAGGLFFGREQTKGDQNDSDESCQMGSVGSDTGSRSVEDSTIDYPVIDNQSYWYVSQVLLPSSPEAYIFNLEAIRVDYGYEADLPVVLRGY